MSEATLTVMRLERGCEAVRSGMGCGCLGTCHELISVVPVEEAMRLIGERDEARRQSEMLADLLRGGSDV